MKIGIYCCLIADILTKVLQKCSLSCPLQNIHFLFQPLNVVSYHGNQKVKFEKKYSKINSSEAVWGIKLKLCRIISNNSLYKGIVFYCSSTLDAMAS